MGMQVQMLMCNKKKELLMYLLKNGYVLVVVKFENELFRYEKIFDEIDLFDENIAKIRTVFVTQIDFLNKIHFNVNAKGASYLSNEIASKMIEIEFSRIYNEDKRITRGRVYFGNGFSATLTKEETEVGKDNYRKITNWIKKNVKYRKGIIKEFNGKQYVDNIYAEDELFNLIMQEGYFYR